MKTIVFAFVALLSSANARSQEVQTSDLDDSSFIEEIANDLVEIVTELIKERGLDPYVVEAAEGEYALDGIFFANGRIDNFVFSGLSNIFVNSVSFSGSTLDIDISLPRISTSVDNVFSNLTVGSRNIQSEFSGSVAIVDLRLAVRISLGFSDSLLDDFQLSCRLGGIEADFKSFVIQGLDFTDSVNNFVGNTLPNLLIQYEEQINRIFQRMIIRQVESVL